MATIALPTGHNALCGSVLKGNSKSGSVAFWLRDAQPANGAKRGQSLVEFALILPLFLLMTLVFIQLILIGAVALAVNQAAASCARYAALDSTRSESTVDTYLKSIASPLINDSYLAAIAVSPGGVPRVSGSSVTVTVSYDLTGKLVLGSHLFGVVFPTTIAVSDTMVSN